MLHIEKLCIPVIVDVIVSVFLTHWVSAVIFAHSLAEKELLFWEPLEDHASNVAVAAGQNADSFGAEVFGNIVGWLHDLGKAKPAFQAKLMGAANSVSHSGEGARFAVERFGNGLGRMMAYAIAGHHSGLPNGIQRCENGRPATPLEERLSAAEELVQPEWMSLPELTMPKPLEQQEGQTGFAYQFFTRMLFSALVDADFIATEAFYSPELERECDIPLEGLKVALDRSLARFGPPETDVNRLRAEVLDAARRNAKLTPGVFSLTVPTGGGKTLASLAFALNHAIQHNKRRVIHVAPYAAIIDQTAQVFRDVLGNADAVLEHHTAFQAEERFDETRAEQMRLAAQNWDRPVVVTTAVQFFESLFANRTQKCRKLHNIAGSVIVLDEAQSLPLLFLRPCLAALGELVRGYGCSVVLCTATQPAVHDCDGLSAPEALKGAATREIAPEPERLYQALRRVEVTHLGQLDNQALAERVRGRSALVIVNNKRQARVLFDDLRRKGVFHLSTHMTARHRRAVLEQVRTRLAAKEGVLLMATALVEAGVDLDFPEVWRAVAGLDSIAQAAGRCNREGQMDGPGRVFVFEPDADFTPPPELVKNAEVAGQVMRDHPDPLTPEAMTAYFRKLYRDRGADLDAKGIMQQIADGASGLNFPFASIARDFRLIEDVTVPLIVAEGPFGMDAEVADLLRYSDHAGALARKLQPFTVQVGPRVRAKLLALGVAEAVRPEVFGDQFVKLTNAELYDPEAGFSAENAWDLGLQIA